MLCISQNFVSFVSCFCHEGLNHFKLWFKPLMAETYQPIILSHTVQIMQTDHVSASLSTFYNSHVLYAYRDNRLNYHTHWNFTNIFGIRKLESLQCRAAHLHLQP